MMDLTTLRELLIGEIHTYEQEHQIKDLWLPPLVGVADAADPAFAQLKQAVGPGHAMPQDILPTARSVISYFVPFLPEVGASNIDGLHPSQTWAWAYRTSNTMFAHINDRMVEHLRQAGYEAQIPGSFASMDMQLLKSNWSQRHVAWVAGLGTFGLNNMLITQQGCLGRLGSFVTSLPLEATPRPQKERCLAKRGLSCEVCVRRCPTGALTAQGFDRHVCYGLCHENDLLLNPPDQEYQEAEICGKCVVSLPCTLRNPCAALDKKEK